jgi:transcription antitermination factor NusG
MKISSENWFALKTMSRAEKKVQERLELKVIKNYLPLQTSIRKWSDRKKKIKIPLMPGYIFVRTQRELLKELLLVNGVFGIVKHLKEPAIIKEYEIENLQILLNEHSKVEHSDFMQWNLGENIEISEGIFKGFKGRVIDNGDKQTLLVKLESIGYHFQVNIPTFFIKK